MSSSVTLLQKIYFIVFVIFAPLCAFTSNQSKVVFPRWAGIRLYTFFPLGRSAFAVVVVVDLDENRKKLEIPSSTERSTCMMKKTFPRRPGIKFYAICNIAQVPILNYYAIFCFNVVFFLGFFPACLRLVGPVILCRAFNRHTDKYDISQ